MHRLRNRLIAAFLVATIVPLAATAWITTSLLERSLDYATTEELDRLSRSLEDTVRQFYQRERDALRAAALGGRVGMTPHAIVGIAQWPEPLRAFWESGEPERFDLSGPGGDHLDYMRRADRGVEVYSRDLGGIRMQELSAEFGQTRELVGSIEGRDLRRGFTLALFLLVALVWLVSLAPVMFIAHRFSQSIQQLTAGLTDFAAGDWDRRLETGQDDEVGHAITAFNHMAEQLDFHHGLLDGTLTVVRITADDGDLRIRVEAGSRMQEDWAIHTDDGSVSVALPEQFAADLVLRTDDGGITVDQPITMQGAMSRHQLSGQLNGGGRELRVTSDDGRIIISR